MIDPQSSLPITRQCEWGALSRGPRTTVPRHSAGETEGALNQNFEAIYEGHPYYGSRRMRLALRDRGGDLGLRRIRRVMREMRLTPIHPARRTSVRDPSHEQYPYLLRDQEIAAPNEVWTTGFTYLPMRAGLPVSGGGHGLVQPAGIVVEVVEHAGCGVLRGGVERTLEASWLPGNLQHGSGIPIHERGVPEGVAPSQHYDQYGWQGGWRDNAVVERFWRSLKYKCVYLHAFEDSREAQARNGVWIECYNQHRPHQALDYRTSDDVYHDDRMEQQHAA